MLYFLTDWRSEQSLDSDVVFNVNTIFQEAEVETKIINTQISPFLNYLINVFDHYDSDHFISLMNTVSEHFTLSAAPLTVQELKFSKDWEKTYTRDSVLLSKEGVIKAEVHLNSFGFVSQVYYYSKFKKERQTYSEKGYLLSKETLNYEGEVLENLIFDEQGRLLLTDFGDTVSIGENYKKAFKKATYTSFKEVCIELLHLVLVHFNVKEDRLVIDGTNAWVMSLIEGIGFPESVSYIFSGSTQSCLSQSKKHWSLIEKGQGLITDNLRFQEEIMKRNPKFKSKLHFMPLYPTILRLGESNNFWEETIYWQIEQLDSQTRVLFERFLELKLMIRELCLIIESGDESDENKFETQLTHFITQSFEISLSSPEYGLVKQYYEALENEEMTPGLRDLFQAAKKENPIFSRAIEAYLFYKGFSFRKKSSVESLKVDLQTVRLFIDQRQKYDFLSHSLAVSAGIPLLSKTPSPYLVNGKNGLLYQDDEEVVEAVHAYLTDPDLWNQSLVESVEVIENNSAEGLIEKWKEVLK